MGTAKTMKSKMNEKNLFYSNVRIQKLEKEEKWAQSTLEVYEKFLESPKERRLFLKCSVNCWYVLTEWYTFMPDTLEQDFFVDMFNKMYAIFQERYYEDSYALMFWGYFFRVTSTTPLYYLEGEEDIDEISKKGLMFWEKSKELDIDNMLVRYWLDEDYNFNKRFWQRKRKLFLSEKDLEVINGYFDSDMEIDCYFLDI